MVETKAKLYIPWIVERLDNLVDEADALLCKQSYASVAYKEIIPKFTYIVHIWKLATPHTPLSGSTSGFNYVYASLIDLDWLLHLTDPVLLAGLGVNTIETTGITA